MEAMNDTSQPTQLSSKPSYSDLQAMLEKLAGVAGGEPCNCLGGDKYGECDFCQARSLLDRTKNALETPAVTVVNEQANDEGLWFLTPTASEAYLQQALRRLHAAVEGKTPAAKAGERREYHANGTNWSSVPTVDMPCDFCKLAITEHDPRTHACPPLNGRTGE